MNKKIISLFLAAAMSVTLAGCSSEGNAGSGKLVAYIENPPEGTDSGFYITYDEWHSEYLFNMMRGGYDEVTNSDVAENYKRSILDYQVQEHIVLYLAKQVGVSGETMTQEDLDEIEQNVQKSWDDWCKSYEAEAKSELGDSCTEEELYEKEFELFTAFMAESGLTPEVFYEWEMNAKIQEKFIEKTSESISDETVADFVQDTVDEAKEMYETDLAAFEQSYTAFYVPEGTRIVQQLYVKIDTDAANEIKAYRNDGDDEKADELLEAALEPVRPIIEEAFENLQNGEEWLTVQEEYNQDDNGNNIDYVVYPASTYVSQDIMDAAMSIEQKGGFSDIITIDSGFFILYYKDDRVFSDEEMQSLLDQARDYLKEQESYNQVSDFMKQYPYVYDYELMGISSQ